MDVDLKFPVLAQLAKEHGTSLAALAANAKHHEGYITFGDCCWLVQQDAPSWSHADGGDYLATLDAFLTQVKPSQPSSRRLWKKVSTGRESQFLDTVAEAAWALHFKVHRVDVELESKFEPLAKHSKDADFRIGPPQRGLWLDVCSVQVAAPSPDVPHLPHHAFPTLSRDAVIAMTQRKALNKYASKFKDATTSGALRDQAVGILLGFPKAEQDVIPSLLAELSLGIKIPAPSGLFDAARPSLALVWGFTLTRAMEFPFLLPSLILPWSHPAWESDPFVKLLQPQQLAIQTRPYPFDPNDLKGLST